MAEIFEQSLRLGSSDRVITLTSELLEALGNPPKLRFIDMDKKGIYIKPETETGSAVNYETGQVFSRGGVAQLNAAKSYLKSVHEGHMVRFSVEMLQLKQPLGRLVLGVPSEVTTRKAPSKSVRRSRPLDAPRLPMALDKAPRPLSPVYLEPIRTSLARFNTPTQRLFMRGLLVGVKQPFLKLCPSPHYPKTDYMSLNEALEHPLEFWFGYSETYGLYFTTQASETNPKRIHSIIDQHGYIPEPEVINLFRHYLKLDKPRRLAGDEIGEFFTSDPAEFKDEFNVHGPFVVLFVIVLRLEGGLGGIIYDRDMGKRTRLPTHSTVVAKEEKS